MGNSMKHTAHLTTAIFFAALTALYAQSNFLNSATPVLPMAMHNDDSQAKPPVLLKGISAWSYSYDPKVVAKINSFNAMAKSDRHFKYFFPYAGSLDFDKGKMAVTLSYDSGKVSDLYAKGLPPGTLIMPIMDARADKKEFDNWTDAQYQAAALKVAAAIEKDSRAAGVQIDIEPFAEGHLPFYQYLRRELNAHGKYTTMYVGAGNGKLLTKIFESCDVVVISGYDLDVENIGVVRYQKLLMSAMARVQRVAAKTHGKYMVGIPAAASWGEYEYTVDRGGHNRVETGNRQEDYVRAALGVLRDYQKSPEFLGWALWQLSDTRDVDEPDQALSHTKFPDYIRPSVWQILAEYSIK